MSWLLEDVSYIKICNRNHLRRPIKRDSHAVLHQYIFHSKLTCVASYKHWKLLIWTPKRLEKKRQVSDIYWSNWKGGYHHTEPTVPNCTMQGKPMLQWHQWQLAWFLELKNQGHIDNTLWLCWWEVQQCQQSIQDKFENCLIIMIITKLGRAWVNPTLVKVVYIFSYYLLEQASTRYVNNTLNIIDYDIP